MFKFLKKKPKVKAPPVLTDLNNEVLSDGDLVTSHRYNLGKCKIILQDLEYFYESTESGEKVSYVRMIDAITGSQKVTKIGKE